MITTVGFIQGLPGGWEYLLIFLIILIVFGPKSLPKIGNAIGRGIREFKEASEGLTRAIEEETSMSENRDNKASSSVDTSDSSADTPEESYGEESYGEGSYDEGSPDTDSDDSKPPDREHAD